jgi:hypothetical protein
LLDYHWQAEDLIPWAEARSAAMRMAGPYLVEYDPVTGSLKKSETGR